MGIRKGATGLDIENDGHGAFIDNEDRELLLEADAAEVIADLQNAVDCEQRLGAIGGASPLRLPQPRIENGIFHGTLFRGSFGAQANLTRHHIESLGLRFGMRLRFESGETNHEAIYLGRMPPNLLSLVFGDADEEVWSGGRPPLCARVMYDEQLQSEAVALLDFDCQLEGPVEPSPVTVSIVDPPVLPAFDRHYLADRRVEGHTLFARTFLATRRAWAINVGSTELATAGVAFKQPALLEVAAQRFILYPGLGPHDHPSVIEASSGVDMATRARVHALKAEIEAIEEKAWDAEPHEQAAHEAHRQELKRLIEDLLYPPPLRHTAPLHGWITPLWEDDGRQIMLVLPMVGETMPEGVTAGDRVLLTGLASD